jgi:tetratricopeptide (TPR) repeat protein/predicted Ser/Thr protein kinase
VSDPEREATRRLADPAAYAKIVEAAAVPGYLAGWDRYEVSSRLGAGGMGEVFRAWDPRLGRFVALKFLASSDPETIERFQREARAQARVDHPAICKVFEVGEVAGRHYIAMQEIHGVTLDRAARKLTLEQKVQLVREIAEAMHAAHRLGLIHRDLKPGNILVEQAEDGSLRPYVVDFGIARDQQAPPGAATISGMIFGTIGYISPEQARGRFDEIDRRTDVYNLGTILYELVCGRHPYEFLDIVESLARLQTEEPPPPRRFKPLLPADLETIILKAMERDPARRYESARAFADDLRRFLDGEPIVARRASVIYRLRTRLRKHRLLASVIAAALLLLLVAAGYALNERWRADARAELAQRFGMQIKEIELLTRVARMLPPDRAIPIRSIVLPRMDSIRRQMAQRGAVAQGPGSYALARGSLALGDFPRAWSQLEETRRAGYETPDVHYARGQVLGHFYEEAMTRTAAINEPELRNAARREAKRRYRAPAVEELRRAAGASIDAPELLHAQLALYEERFGDAIAAARRAARSAPWLYEAGLLEAKALRAQARAKADGGKFDDALADFAAASERLKSLAVTARADAAIHYEDCVLRSQLLHVVRFQRRITSADAAEATAPCVEASRLDPAMSGPWTTRGSILNVIGEDELRFGGDPSPQIAAAEVAMRRAIALDPHDGAALAGLGRAEQLMARWGIQRGIDPRPRLIAAQGLLERAIAEDPRAASPRITLANSLITRGEYENRLGGDSRPFLLQAIEQARHVLRFEPNIFLAYNLLGNVYNTLADREMARGGDPRPVIADAAAAFDGAAALNPSSAPVHNNRGNTWLALSEYLAGRGESIDDAASRALASYRRAIELRPDYTIAWYNIADISRLSALDRVRRGSDPSAMLRDSRAALDRYDAASPVDVDALLIRARCEMIEARWLLNSRRDPRPALAEADRVARKVLAIDAGAVAAMLLIAERYRWEAEWRRTPDSIRLGLEAAARAKGADPQSAEAGALEAALLFIDARSRYPESAAELRKRAGALAEQALRAKPALRADYGALR